jgi:hypothetical protein
MCKWTAIATTIRTRNTASKTRSPIFSQNGGFISRFLGWPSPFNADVTQRSVSLQQREFVVHDERMKKCTFPEKFLVPANFSTKYFPTVSPHSVLMHANVWADISRAAFDFFMGVYLFTAGVVLRHASSRCAQCTQSRRLCESAQRCDATGLGHKDQSL